jgi:hypothetical protein
VSRIQDVTFENAPETRRNEEQFRNLLTLKLDWNGKAPKPAARVGLAYLERGIRWIPSYRVTLDGAGRAHLELQATIINELLDLEGVTVNLVIGVPSFMFKDTVDPISLQQTVAQLSQYFRADSQFLNLSNAMMTQQVDTRLHRTGESQPGLDLGPDLDTSGKEEDLFVFAIRNLTLGKGERMVIPIADFELAYKDVYTLDIPFVPPPELARNFNTEQQRAMAKLLANPKAEHKVRLSNTSPYPLTTAPALILSRDKEGARDRLLGQGMMTYASVGGSVDLAITTAIDIKTGYSEREVKRTPDALRVDHNSYARTDLEGSIYLKNLRQDAVELEVRRFVSGHINEASGQGEAVNGSLFDFETQLSALGDVGVPFSWPNWFNHVNGAGRASWKLRLEPGGAVDLTYQWHYFWR